MKWSKQFLEDLYAKMSLDEMVDHLGVAKSTVYYYMKKFAIPLRSKRDAQRRHLKTNEHQRIGVTHSYEARKKISDGTRYFWDSVKGVAQKENLGNLRRQEWELASSQERNKRISKLQDADRPAAGELSSFGKFLMDFLSNSKNENVSSGIRLTGSHYSDIILEDRRVVIELIFPTDIYGAENEQRLLARYDHLQQELNAAGYRVVLIEDKSNSISMARCERIYDVLQEFFKNKNQKRLNLKS